MIVSAATFEIFEARVPELIEQAASAPPIRRHRPGDRVIATIHPVVRVVERKRAPVGINHNDSPTGPHDTHGFRDRLLGVGQPLKRPFRSIGIERAVTEGKGRVSPTSKVMLSRPGCGASLRQS